MLARFDLRGHEISNCASEASERNSQHEQTIVKYQICKNLQHIYIFNIHMHIIPKTCLPKQAGWVYLQALKLR